MVGGRIIAGVVLAGGPLGIMQACMTWCFPYVHYRKQFLAQPIG